MGGSSTPVTHLCLGLRSGLAGEADDGIWRAPHSMASGWGSLLRLVGAAYTRVPCSFSGSGRFGPSYLTSLLPREMRSRRALPYALVRGTALRASQHHQFMIKIEYNVTLSG